MQVPPAHQEASWGLLVILGSLEPGALPMGWEASGGPRIGPWPGGQGGNPGFLKWFLGSSEGLGQPVGYGTQKMPSREWHSGDLSTC